MLTIVAFDSQSRNEFSTGPSASRPKIPGAKPPDLGFEPGLDGRTLGRRALQYVLSQKQRTISRPELLEVLAHSGKGDSISRRRWRWPGSESELRAHPFCPGTSSEAGVPSLGCGAQPCDLAVEAAEHLAGPAAQQAPSGRQLVACPHPACGRASGQLRLPTRL